jgi:hypothetical protein
LSIRNDRPPASTDRVHVVFPFPGKFQAFCILVGLKTIVDLPMDGAKYMSARCKDFWKRQKYKRGLMKGRNQDSGGRDIFRLHHDPGRQDSLGHVNPGNHTPFHYKISFVGDGTFPRTGQEVGEDTPKDKKGK